MNEILLGDAITRLREIPDESFNACITSPPYWGLRDYGVDGQLGLEKTPEEFIENMVSVFREVRRVLMREGTLWLNIGDSYSSNRASGFQGKNGARKDRSFTASTIPKTGVGLKNKDLVGIPWMLAFALRADGWYLRQDIIWSKPNPMPESVQDRCTKSHEYIFLLSRSPIYYYDIASIREPATWANMQQNSVGSWGKGDEPRKPVDFQKPEVRAKARRSQPKGSFNGKTGETAFRKTGETRNKRSVWTIGSQAFSDAHFATFPEKLIEPMILASTPPGGVLLDPFMGAGTTALVAKKLGRRYTGIEINPEYIAMAEKRINSVPDSMFL